jgi:hypothetical protein
LTDLKSQFINDIFVLSLQTLEWTKLSQTGMPCLYNFASCIKGDSIFIFGGTNESYQQNKKLLMLKYSINPIVGPPKYQVEPLVSETGGGSIMQSKLEKRPRDGQLLRHKLRLLIRKKPVQLIDPSKFQLRKSLI